MKMVQENDSITYSSSEARRLQTRHLQDPIEKRRTRHLRSTFVSRCNHRYTQIRCTRRSAQVGSLDMKYKAQHVFIPTTTRGLETIDLHLPIGIECLVRCDLKFAQFWRWHGSILRWRIILVRPRRPTQTRGVEGNPSRYYNCSDAPQPHKERAT
jgi:hypothetical protein